MHDIEALRELIVELQSNGIRVSTEQGIGRQGGAGPANGKALDFGEYQVVVPTSGAGIFESPYSLDASSDRLVIKKNDIPIREAELTQVPRYYSLHTEDGIPYWKIALMHGRDCLASTVVQTCDRWNTPDQCKFCSIGTSLASDQTIPIKMPEQLATVAAAALSLDGVKHVTLTAGSTNRPDDAIKYLGDCAAAIKNRTGLPVHVQFEPPEDQSLYYELKEAGVDTVGIHVESFDQRVREHITPGKAKISIEKYYEAFEKAVEVFGKNQVSTFIIIGLDEDRKVTIDGCKKCISMGVYPFVVPLRAVKGSPLADSTPPGKQVITGIYEEVSCLLAKHQLSWRKSKSGCVRCGACSALPAYEKPVDRYIFKVAESAEEVRQYLEVRAATFVEEQGIFVDSDMDEHDADAIPIVAQDGVTGQIVGSVRCYQAGPGTWIGGRLAVLPSFRGTIGPALVRKAVDVVCERGGNKFYAYIQKQNVKFFQKLGWHCTGEKAMHYDKLHIVMEVDLKSRLSQGQKDILTNAKS